MKFLSIALEGNGIPAGLVRDVEEACADASNEMGALTAVRAAAHTPIADEQKIRSLPQQEWWPKKVAKILRARKGVAGANGHYYTRAEAKAASQRIIAKRLRHRGSVRAGWRRSVEVLQVGSVHDPAFDVGQNLPSKGDATPAKPGLEPVCIIENRTRGAEKIAQRALDDAVRDTEKEADKIAEKHLHKRLKKYA